MDTSHCAFYAEKTQFSMLTPAMAEYLDAHAELESVILFGIEVCVHSIFAYQNVKFIL